MGSKGRLVRVVADEMTTTSSSDGYEVIREWEERELIGQYTFLGSDRQHLFDVSKYQIIKYMQIRHNATTSADVSEEIIEVDSRDERVMTKRP
jgi:hypothetical protein